jgi:hypothetical protein
MSKSLHKVDNVIYHRDICQINKYAWISVLCVKAVMESGVRDTCIKVNSVKYLTASKQGCYTCVPRCHCRP